MPRTILSPSSILAVFSVQRFLVLVTLVRELEFRLPFAKPELPSRRIQVVPYTATRNCVKRNGSIHGGAIQNGDGFSTAFYQLRGDRRRRQRGTKERGDRPGGGKLGGGGAGRGTASHSA